MPRHISLIFPGQGSQSIGMLNSFSEDELNYVTKISKEVLDIDIIDCIKNGPEEDLNKTSITQPALLVASYLYYKKFLNLFDLTPNLLAGHSLGEYSALLASNSITIDDAISLVHKRGKCMENSQKGSMFAILNLGLNEINQICKVTEEETGQVISPANINSPNQVVIAGSDKAAKIAAETKAIPLELENERVRSLAALAKVDNDLDRNDKYTLKMAETFVKEKSVANEAAKNITNQ